MATDDQKHAVMWFGETTDDRTYPMPAKVQMINLHCGKSEESLATESIETEELVGVRSVQAAKTHDELFGTVIYGNYHGTKLTYHVEHLPQIDPAAWSSDARLNTSLQTVIVPQYEYDGWLRTPVGR